MSNQDTEDSRAAVLECDNRLCTQLHLFPGISHVDRTCLINHQWHGVTSHASHCVNVLYSDDDFYWAYPGSL